MASLHVFYDYVSARGMNEIEKELDKAGSVVKAEFNAGIRNLEAVDRRDWHEYPFYKSLKRECSGLFELRREIKNVQWRIIGFDHDDVSEVTLAVMFKKKGAMSPGWCKKAFRIQTQVLRDVSKYRSRHAA